MTAWKKIRLLLLAGVIGVGGLELGKLSIPGFHGLIVSAEAVVGRPGVARRTTRRCAAGVYDC
jgi:hypothetical protein